MMSEEPQTWYFTFGFSHLHPRTGACLGNCYTTAYGTYDSSRKRIFEIFDRQWAFQYSTANGSNGAGVNEFNLKYVPCVSYSPGELLPPTMHEIARGSWPLQTLTHVDAESSRSCLIAPHCPTFSELRYIIEHYYVPVDAAIRYDHDLHTVVVEWNSNNDA
jgi:hypothetical protein